MNPPDVFNPYDLHLLMPADMNLSFEAFEKERNMERYGKVSGKNFETMLLHGNNIFFAEIPIMDQFCGSKFWDSKLTWYTEFPQFTSCFEDTVLIWVPCLFLWITSIFSIRYAKRSNYKNIPWGYLNVAKIAWLSILAILILLDIGYAFVWHPMNMVMYGVDYVSGPVKLLTFILLIHLVNVNRKYGVRSSGIVFIFWLLLITCAIPHYITELRNSILNKTTLRLYPFVSNIIYFPLVFSLFILECFVDSPPRFSRYPPIPNLSPDNRVSFLNKVFIVWFDIFAIKSFKTPLTINELWNLDYESRIEYLVPQFQKYWNQRALKRTRETPHDMLTLNGLSKNKPSYRSMAEKQDVSILPILWKIFGWSYFTSSLFKLIVDLVIFVNPQVLSLLINFEDSQEPLWRGFLYSFLLLLNGMLTTIFLNWYVYRVFNTGLQIRSLLIAVIYRKALKISNNAVKSFSLGDITNLMAVDAQRFYDVILYLNMAFSAPYTIIIALYFLWNILGVSALAGVALMVIIIPINGFAANKIKTYQIKQMEYKDERVKITNEVLSGIKVLKMYAWEKSFEQRILEIRNKEVQLLKFAAYVNTAIAFLWTSAPFLVSLVTFAVYTLSSKDHVLNASVAFVSLSLFNIIRLPISMVPRMVTCVVQVYVSQKRINRYLNSEEIDSTAITHNPLEKHPLIIERGTFTWKEDNESATLRNIDLKISAGSLVAVVGPVGSGKSSLVSALLGEMNKIDGYVNTKGSIAYVPQQAWLQNATLRENILFTKEYKRTIYSRVVEACALLLDFEILPAGDATEIGEKGINLSGGQKQRISLARAVYSDADTYLLDDPLSAVDAHVGKHIFEQVIGSKGLLRKKTRLLVTHSITYLSEVDYIVVMKDGCIYEKGTFEELMSKQGVFCDFVTNYSPEEATPTNDPENVPDISEITHIFQRTISEESAFLAQTCSIPTPVDEEPTKLPVIGEKLTVEETVLKGNIKFSTYLHYLKSCGTFLCVVAVLFNGLYQASSVGANVWLTQWSTDPTVLNNGTQTNSKSYYYLGMYGVYGLAQAVTIYIGTWAMYIGTINASVSLHSKLLNKILRWPSYQFDVTPLGRIINRFSYDVDVIDNMFPLTIKQMLNVGGAIISTIVVITFSSPIFLTVFLPISVVYIFVEQVYVAITRQLRRLESISRNPIFSHFSETVSGSSLIRAYGFQDKFISESEHRTTINHIYSYPAVLAFRWVSGRLDLIGFIIIFFSALFGVLERGTINSGIIGLSVSYALQIVGSLNWFVRTASDIESNIVAVERIKGFDETVEENDSGSVTTVSAAWPDCGKIVFDNFQVRYREGLDLVLRGLNITINGGEKIGIAGRTGAGKSSLTLSLFRIVEAAAGRILIDDVDIALIDLQTLRSRLTIIPQDPVLFSGPMRINLDPFFEHTDSDVWHALELAHLKTYILSLPNGLYYEVSENGNNLSIGQRQLICLARALLRKTKVLILDEATAAIDLETDELIQNTIRSEFKHCTVLTIAHRLNTIMDSDRVIVLDNGLVIEFDSPGNLLRSKDTIFYGMAKDSNLVS